MAAATPPGEGVMASAASMQGGSATVQAALECHSNSNSSSSSSSKNRHRISTTGVLMFSHVLYSPLEILRTVCIKMSSSV